jgi:hypothetical protein
MDSLFERININAARVFTAITREDVLAAIAGVEVVREPTIPVSTTQMG